MKYKNPILSGFHPDPSICRVDKDFYLVTSSFEYFPGVPIFHSRDLVNWKQIGYCLNTSSQLPLENTHSSGGIFAPTLRYYQGKFYMITTNVSDGGNFYVWAEKPEGPWSEPIWLNDWPGIDPSLLFDEDRAVYITGTRDGDKEDSGIYQAKIDIETGELLSQRKLIWRGTGGAEPEGPHLYKIGEYYYLMISEGGTEYGHMVTIARSKNPFGPFESYSRNPILSHRSTKSPIQATGHADLVQFTDGSWWGVFLGFRPIGYPPKHHLGRETFLAPVSWNEEGWPIFGSNGMVEEEVETDVLSVPQKVEWVENDDFTDEKLNLKWNFRRNPVMKNYSLEKKKGWLTLRGSGANLSDKGSHTFVGRRQEHFNCMVSTHLDFVPHNGEEAGITIFANENFHYDIALTKMDGKNKVILRKTVGSLSIVEQAIEYDPERITFLIEADEWDYKFSYSTPSNETVELGKGECGMLSKEVAGGFTGVYFGLYATGNGKESKAEAHFDWFNYVI